MKFNSIAAVLALSMAGPAMAAACSSTANWGSMGPPGSRVSDKSFSSNGNYLDCYTFSLTSLANSIGVVTETDPWKNQLDIDVWAVGIFSGGVSANGYTTGSLLGADYNSPNNFSFKSLSAGTYTLAVVASVTKDYGKNSDPVSYRVSMSTTGVSVASPAPEPESYALVLAGLAGVGFAARRRKQG